MTLSIWEQQLAEVIHTAVKEYCKRSGDTQDDIAGALGLCTSTFKMYLSGARRIQDIAFIRALCLAINDQRPAWKYLELCTPHKFGVTVEKLGEEIDNSLSAVCESVNAYNQRLRDGSFCPQDNRECEPKALAAIQSLWADLHAGRSCSESNVCKIQTKREAM